MKPIRILHVLGPMHRAGIETWLMHVLRQIDRERYHMTFLVHTNEPAAYDEEVRALGAQILPCPFTRRPIKYAQQFLEIAKRFGLFDVLHSHVHNFSGFVVWLGSVAGIPTRIAHSHNDTRVVDGAATYHRKAYLSLTGRLLTRFSTCRLAASASAASALYGDGWRRDRRTRILYYGVDLAPYSLKADRSVVRSEFGFKADDIVFGHAGRFVPQKNHDFLINIAAEIAKRETKAKFLFLGEGPLRPLIEDRVRRAGLAGRTVFAGSRPDVPRLMQGAMDRFLFPSHYEGLGLVLTEAQAADLPAIISDAIPSEVDVVPNLITRLSLQQPAAVWAQQALLNRDSAASNGLKQIEGSAFNIVASVKYLMDIYSAQH